MSAKSGRRLLDDQDEMEYNITFPTSTGIDDSDMKEPVVYLLSWAGASDKLLAKYSAIYEQEGCVTLRYIIPEDIIFLPSKKNMKITKDTSHKLVQLLDDYDLRENPVLIHCFSNGGAVLYRWLAEAFLHEKVNLVGAVIDSAPARLTFVSGLMAIWFSQRHKGLFHTFHYIGRFVSTVLARLFSFTPNHDFDFYEHLLTSTTFLWPHLFLASSGDTIINISDVLEMADSRKKAGCTFVRTHDFVTSYHVQHLKLHKEEYTNQCLQFLDDCLKIFDEEENSGTNKQISSVDPPAKQRPFSEGLPSTSQRRSSARLRKTSQSDSKL